MTRHSSLFGYISVLLLFISISEMSFAEPTAQNECHTPPTIIHSVRLFDGKKVYRKATVVIECNKISKVSKSNKKLKNLPKGSTLIDGIGKTLMPGIIDAHVHVFQHEKLERMLDWGVTTGLDMGSGSKDFMQSIIKQDTHQQATNRADIFGAVLWVTAPKSHGTQWGPVPTLDNPEDADAFIEQRFQDGASFIKLIYDQFKMVPRKIPTLSDETMKAVIQAAHKRGLLAVSHSRDLESYNKAIKAGVDGFVHLPIDAVPDKSLLKMLKKNNIFTNPNLALARHDGLRLLEDPIIGPKLNDSEIENIKNFRKSLNPDEGIIEYGTLKTFYNKGIAIVLGTDSPNSGTTYGAGMHLELELAVEAGMDPIDALASATSVTAKRYRLNDRGRIVKGMLADLILVEGAPDINIKDTRRIVKIWKAGTVHQIN